MVNKKIIIIPTLNNQAHIRATLNSIPNGWDILIIDSGSNDDTLSICEEYSAQIIIREMSKWDAGAQRNYALENVIKNYDVILFLDSDEIMTVELEIEIDKLPADATLYGSIKSKYFLLGKPLISISRNTFHDRLLIKPNTHKMFTSSPGEVFDIERSRIVHLEQSYLHHIDAKGVLSWFKRILEYAYENGKIDCEYIISGKTRLTKNYGGFRRYRIVLLIFLPIAYLAYYVLVRRCYKDGLVGIIFSFVMSMAYVVYPVGFVIRLFR